MTENFTKVLAKEGRISLHNVIDLFQRYSDPFGLDALMVEPDEVRTEWNTGAQTED